MKTILKHCKGGIMAAAAACFIALVYGPLELYFINREDFWFAPDIIVPDVVFLFAAAMLGSILLLALANRFAPKLYTLLTGCFVWGALVCYIHSNFLSGWLPSMDGETVDWSAYPAQRVISIAVCVVIAAFVGVLTYKKWLQKAAFWGGSVLTLLLAITVLTLGIGSAASAEGNYYFSTNKAFQKYSSDQNFVIFVVDTVDGSNFEKLVNETPEYQEALRDLTYYNNAMSGYGYTGKSVCQLLSGQWYEGSIPYDKFRSEALADSSFFADLQNRGYEMGIYYGHNFIDKNAGPERFVNLSWSAPDIVSHPALWRVILRMSCVKNAPYDFKRLGYCLPEKLNGLIHRTSNDFENRFDGDDLAFLNLCQAASITTDQDKVFKYIHIEGAHAPFLYGPHLEDVAGTEQATYQNSVAASIYVIGNYLDMLRENGVYDNTAILVISDHGYADGIIAKGRQHTILLAKGFGEHHDYAVNEAPISYEDMQEIYQNLLNGCQSDEISAYKAGDARERRYLLQNDDKDKFIEYVQTGRAEDMSTLKETGRVYKIAKAVGE